VDAARSSAEENESCRPEGRVKVEHVPLRSCAQYLVLCRTGLGEEESDSVESSS